MYVLELAGEADAFAASEARTAAAGVEIVGPGVAVADRVEPAGVERLAYTRRASALLGRGEPTVAAAREIVVESAVGPSEREASRPETVAVRARAAREVDAPTRETERAVGGVLVDRGWTVDLDAPDRTLVVVFTEDECLVGWAVAASRRGYGERAPTKRPFFQPGSMDPLDARACVNLAGAGRGRLDDGAGAGGATTSESVTGESAVSATTASGSSDDGGLFVDPMCGTGGLLIEAGLAGSDVVGIDRQSKMVRGTRENLAAYVDGGSVVRGDATQLPVATDAASGVAFDAPYGRQSKIAGHDLRSLVAGALEEGARIAPRGVLVADRSYQGAARDAGWTVRRVFERRVHRSLVRHVHLLRR